MQLVVHHELEQQQTTLWRSACAGCRDGSSGICICACEIDTPALCAVVCKKCLQGVLEVFKPLTNRRCEVSIAHCRGRDMLCSLPQLWCAVPCCVVQWPKVLNAPLAEVDPELHDIIEKEKNRQYKVCVWGGGG
jgi:hypothetical protein